MSYHYWNNFVDNWRSLPNAEFANLSPNPQYDNLQGWQNPNLTPLMNSDNQGDYSLQYLPEPWWGNNGDHILNSVVINYNPGSGQQIQHINQANGLFRFNNYGDFVNNESVGLNIHFSHTRDWHVQERATRVFNSLSRTGVDLNGDDNINNHLSIELIPWHTRNTKGIEEYIQNNLQMIYENIFLFAANESRRINNARLQSKVVVRMSGNNTMKLIKQLLSNGICTYHIINIIQYTPLGRGGYFKFAIDEIPNVQFISIWNKGGHNSFPPNQDMDWIFENIV